MERYDVGQHGGGDLTRLGQSDGSNSYDAHSGGLSRVSSEAGQPSPLSNITYPSELMLPETGPSSASLMNSAYTAYGTGTQGVEQLNLQGGYGAPVAQSHYTPQIFDTGAATTTAFKATSSPVLVDGSTLTPLPAGVPLPPRNTTPYLVETGMTSTLPSRDTQARTLLPGGQDLSWLTTDTVQGSGVSAYEQLTHSSYPGVGHGSAMVPESDVEERLAKMQNMMEEKFGMQRKKFMNHMMQTESKRCPPIKYSEHGTQCDLCAHWACL